eukprot:12688822-Prorocentrum_lima.AAC.1
MRDGQIPQAIVLDGCALHRKATHPPGDPFHVMNTPENTDAIEFLQMLFWDGRLSFPISMHAVKYVRAGV